MTNNERMVLSHLNGIKYRAFSNVTAHIFDVVSQPVKAIDHFIKDGLHPRGTLMRYFVISRPAISNLLVRCGSAKPSYTGQM